MMAIFLVRGDSAAQQHFLFSTLLFHHEILLSVLHADPFLVDYGASVLSYQVMNYSYCQIGVAARLCTALLVWLWVASIGQIPIGLAIERWHMGKHLE